MSTSQAKSGYCFAIDRGGTFTDVFCKKPDGSVHTLKLLSVDPSSYPDAPREGIRRLLGQPADSLIDPSSIEWIRMGTTVATNALLERKGEPVCLCVTAGFRDLLFIGNQSRPDIFDLKVTCPDVLYSDVIEVDERVVLSHDKSELSKFKIKSQTGGHVEVWKKVDRAKLEQDLHQVLQSGIKALAVVLINSYAYPDHEREVKEVAEKIGFNYITLSSDVMPMIKAVPRGLTTTADAYLTPKIQDYIRGFVSAFDPESSKSLNVLFMKSDGGLSPVSQFNGSKAILSGPAGGVVGYALTCQEEFGPGTATIGFDMGGTSTDVSRFDGSSFDHTFEAIISGITIQSPQLDIKTVAAGGGSMLMYRSGLFVVGPESAGAFPGPACYRNNGPLTVTDANLVLGRVLPEYFPKIFGPGKDQGLDEEATRSKFRLLMGTMHEMDDKSMSMEEVALGFIRVANESMCRPIRSITEGKGLDSSSHVLSCFGGAGGQHACAVAKSLNITKVFVHRFSGIVSAYGMALADVVTEAQEPISLSYSVESMPVITERLDKLKQKCRNDLLKHGFPESNIQYQSFLNMRYQGTDFAIMTQPDNETGDFEQPFITRYKREFGFTLPGRSILIDDVRVRAVAKSDVDASIRIASCDAGNRTPKPEKTTHCYFEQVGFLDTAVYKLEHLLAGHQIPGPAMIIDQNSTILIEPDCTASITERGNIIIAVPSRKHETDSGKIVFDPIMLSLFSHRFMSIAEQMGTVLQRTSISTNIKERLDFSCALFGPDGGLVSNAPHIPVHLGAMQKAVQFQLENLKNNIHPGDVILSNHPIAGGSHLPDLTVITPVFDKSSPLPVFFVASRGHHADIGGSKPGSMPPDSHSIHEEGATFVSFKVVDAGVFQEKELIELLMAPRRIPGCSGCRCLNDVISDIQAQIAANNRGINLVKQLVQQFTLPYVQAYMKFIQENAEVAVRQMLKTIAANAGSTKFSASDFMDDGTEIVLNIQINQENGSAVFDFTGTGIEVINNLNAPEAVTFSAIIYCLRCMIGYDVPLNQGCLFPIKVMIPKGSILSPSPDAAVVGGNVETSQRVVDVILKAFGACAASQGCMNNVTFGDETHGYYETIAGGAGAGPGWNGRHAIHSHMTNTRITDVEIMEKRYPVIVNKFHVNKGSGGKGKFSGGDGVIRELLFRKNMIVSILTERRVFAPYGLNGGGEGAKGKNTLTIAETGRVVYLGGKCSVPVSAGDLITIQTPGGGGYGIID